ncbi:MAG: protein translocase subunit SecF [Dehalococcoidia bacterium]
MWNIVRYRIVYFVLSAVLISSGLITLYMGSGLSLSIEFTGGAAIRAQFDTDISQGQVEVVVNQLGYENYVVQGFGDGEFFIRLPLSDDAVGQENQVRTGLEQLAAVNMNFDQVSPSIASETMRNALIAVMVAVLGILAYIIYAFRGVQHSFRYGICAVIALAHDILMAFAVSGVVTTFASNIFRLEISSMFLVGVLTLLGYSINDTIVVFDRIRENLLRETHGSLEDTVNFSILESMGRSINTSFTTLLVLLSLLLVGPSSIFDFLFVMIVGVVSGTYSSIFVASQVLVYWEQRRSRALG